MCALVAAFAAVIAGGAMAVAFGPESVLIVKPLVRRKWRSLGGIARDSDLSRKTVRGFLRDHSDWFDRSSIRVGGECLYALSEKGYQAITELSNAPTESTFQKLSTSKEEPLGDTHGDFGKDGKSDSEEALESDSILNLAAEFDRVVERRTRATRVATDSPEDKFKPTVSRKALMVGANLKGAVLSRRDLSRTNLARANLRGASMDGAVLVDANLSGSDMLGANLNGADLCDANLQDAVLFAADLGGADLRGTNLAGADLRRANLIGAKNLTPNQLVDAVLDDSTILPDHLRDVYESNRTSDPPREKNDGVDET